MTHLSRYSAAFAALSALACGQRAGDGHDAAARPPLVGTYAITLRGAGPFNKSDSAEVWRGHLMLLAEPVDTTAANMSVNARRQVVLSGYFVATAEGPLNACWVLVDSTGRHGEWVSFGHWSATSSDSQAVHLSFDRSADSGYELWLIRLPDGSIRSDTAVFWSASTPETEHSDTASGRRVGPAEVGPCVQAAGPAWERGEADLQKWNREHPLPKRPHDHAHELSR